MKYSTPPKLSRWISGRKLIVGLSLLSLGFLAAAARAEAPAKKDSRPNFLFLITDDQRWDEMGCVQREQGEKGRFPWFQNATPNMDRLASEGVRFRNAFVVNSLCSPSRASFLTGLYNHRNGVINNHTPMPLDMVTSARLLGQAGYNTVYIGKFHHGTQEERPGFDYIYSYLGQGNYFDCPFNVNGTLTPSKGWIDDVATDYAIKFLKEHQDKPFDMVLGFKSPHDPRTPPDWAKNLFPGAEARVVPNLTVRAPFLPPLTNGQKRLPKIKLDKAVLDHFRCIAAADAAMGRLLKALEELGLSDNTMIVFVGDNGYYENEHQLGDKRTAYEESLRIPLLVRYPKLQARGAVRDEMVLNIDLPSTLLDYAGVPIPSQMQGLSWRPLLDKSAAKGVMPQESNWRHAFFYEYFFENPYNFAPTTLAVRTETAKLIKYPGHDDWTELFDLKADPYETRNLWSDPASTQLREQMLADFNRQAQAVAFKMPTNIDKPKPKAQKGPTTEP